MEQIALEYRKLCERLWVHLKYAFMREHQSQFRLRSMCRVLQVSASGYYDWLGRPESRRASEDRQLVQHIQRIHHGSRQAYGTLKVHRALRDEGVVCGKHRIARLRRAHGIQTRRRRRFVVTTRSKHRHWIAPNLLERCFTVVAPNQTWVGDVTFVATRAGWLYLAVLLDLYSRKVVGWSMGERNNLELVRAALQMAVDRRHPAPGLIHHTDRGLLYATSEYRALMSQHGMVASMSRKKDCWDNAVAESFFATLKNELLYGRDYRARDQARSEIFEYIEVFYNRQRIHQTLNYRSPLAFEVMTAVA